MDEARTNLPERPKAGTMAARERYATDNSHWATMKAELRHTMWQLLMQQGAVRFPGAHSRIPNFPGADRAAHLLRKLAVWRKAQVVKVNLDAPQLSVRRAALADGTVDTVVSTFTLCTISGVVQAIREIARVLKPDGTLIFFELGCSPDSQVRHWQARLEPIYRWLFRGLYLTRDIPALITQGGFGIAQLEAAYIAAFPKSTTYCWWGIAIPHAR